MRLFSCAYCAQRLYFENVSCTRCGATLGFLPDSLALVSLKATGDGRWRPQGEKQAYRLCANYERHAVCNWMLSANDENQAFCLACRLNRTIPDLNVQGNIERWRSLETEKRRLVYTLLRLGLPVVSHADAIDGLGFDFLADIPFSSNKRDKVLTGHANGLITINIREADPAESERLRGQMDEPYRTLLGHFRHESGHYYWDRLIGNTPWLQECRRLFGDDRMDYGKALERHYRYGAPVNWQVNFISGYASMHPWEDWAETWAHYLHIIDTLETAWQFGLGMDPQTGTDAQNRVHHDFDPYREKRIETLIEHWLPLTFVLNSLNRSMGHKHAYPFVLSPNTIRKLGFIHQVVRGVSV
jgi:hypothetical protein